MMKHLRIHANCSDEIIDDVRSDDDTGEEIDESEYKSENDIENEGMSSLGPNHVGDVWAPVLQPGAGPPNCIYDEWYERNQLIIER